MRRTLLAITAVLLATIGTTLLYVYVSTADNRAKAQIAQVEVLVATQDADKATAASALHTTHQDVATVDKTPNAIDSLNDVQGLVLTMKVLKGQQITSRMFGKATVGALPEGHQAVSLLFGEADRVPSLTKAGSTVAVYKLGTPQPVLEKAVVLSVQTNGIVTFDVTQIDAQKLLDAVAASGGRLVLVYTGQNVSSQ